MFLLHLYHLQLPSSSRFSKSIEVKVDDFSLRKKKYILCIAHICRCDYLAVCVCVFYFVSSLSSSSFPSSLVYSMFSMSPFSLSFVFLTCFIILYFLLTCFRLAFLLSSQFVVLLLLLI